MIFGAGGVTLLIHEASEPCESPRGGPPNEAHPADAAEDVDAVFDDLASTGLETVTAADYDWGRAAYLRDPDGQLIEIVAE